MEIFVIRHGETMWNREHRLQGRTDIPLNDAGLAGARIASEALRHIHFDHVFSSPLARAYKTAEIICQYRKDLTIETCDDIKEISFGIGEGLNLSDDNTNDKETLKNLQKIRDWFHDPDTSKPLPGGESVPQIKARLQHFIDTQILPNEDKYHKVLIASHGGIVRGIEAIVKNLDDSDFWKGPIVPNCGALVLSLNNGHLKINRTVDLINKDEASDGLAEFHDVEDDTDIDN